MFQHVSMGNTPIDSFGYQWVTSGTINSMDMYIYIYDIIHLGDIPTLHIIITTAVI